MDTSTLTTSTGEQLVVKPEKAAAMLDCSRSQIYALVKSGQLRAIKLSPGKKGGVRILTESIFDFVSQTENPARELTPAEIVAAQQARANRSRLAW
jgi:excisionase family DNA binding protein